MTSEPSSRAIRRRSDVQAAFGSYSDAMFAFFGYIFTRALRGDFRAVRLSRASPLPLGTPRLVIYSNHPSWWDAAIIIWLGAAVFKRRVFSPMEKGMLERYRFMRRIGAFGIGRGSREDAAFFLAASSHVLQTPRNILVITAQGRFADIRERPLGLASGVAHVAMREPEATLVPLAIEYGFWDERKPEVFLRFGPPVPAGSLVGLGGHQARERLSRALEETMDALAVETRARDARAFRTLLAGQVGVGGVYDLWRRARALLTGARFEAAHGDGG